MTSLRAIVLVVIVTLVSTAANVLMKAGLNTGKDLFSLAVDPLLISGIALLILAGVLFTLALREGELSVIHPFLSLGFIWIVFASRLLGETMAPHQYVGVASVVFGVSLIGHRRKR